MENGKGLTSERLEKFKSVVQQGTGEFVIIVAAVDPDAIGAAMALAVILNHVRTGPSTVRIVYAGHVAHPQNQAIFNHCNLHRDMMFIGEYTLTNDATLVLVDSHSLLESRLGEKFTGREPAIVIDHHRGENGRAKDNQFYWIEEVGAASTLVAELAKATETVLDGHIPLLLTLGIYTDTKAQVAAGPRDRAAYGFVRELVKSNDELMQLINYTLPESFYENMAYALSHRTRNGGKLVANMGYIKSEDSDQLAMIADELLREDGVTAVLVWGIVSGPENQTIRISARSTNRSLALDPFLKKNFGQGNAGAKQTPDGRGEGGALLRLDFPNWMNAAAKTEAGRQKAEDHFSICINTTFFELED